MGVLAIIASILSHALRDASSLHGRPLAPGANVQPLHSAIDHERLPMDVRLEVPIGAPLREADVMSKALRLTTNVTLASHAAPFRRFVHVADVWRSAAGSTVHNHAKQDADWTAFSQAPMLARPRGRGQPVD